MNEIHFIAIILILTVLILTVNGLYSRFCENPEEKR
jgi:hypothetical protein